MKLIYIAHPLFGDGSEEWGNTEKNVERYLRCVAAAVNEGVGVITWVHYWHAQQAGLLEGDEHYFLQLDCALLERADELWVCGPPEVSGGIRTEMGHARLHGIPVVRRLDIVE